MGEIVWLGRYPVKSLLGEALARADLDGAGLVGDRIHAVVDVETGLVASAKHPRRWRAMLSLSARTDPGTGVRITTADGVEVTDDAALSAVLGRPVRLTDHRPDDAALERETPEVEAGAGTLTRGRLAAGPRFVDFGAVHVVTTDTLDALDRADARRFRPNVVVRLHDPRPFAENDWCGHVLSTRDGVRLRVDVPTPRCPVPTLAHGPNLPPDPAVLRRAAHLNRVPVLDLGPLTCVGVYASVDHPGRLRVGDTVHIGP